MATNFPGSLDTATQQPSPSSTTDLDASGYEHDVVHTNHSGAIIALETKLGTGGSNAVADAVLMGTGSGTSAWDTSPTFKGAVTVGVDDTGHDVKFYGAGSGNYMLWDESANSLLVSGKAFISKLQVGQLSFTQEPWNDSTIALGNYGSIGTQGSYRTYMSWNYERGTDSNFHHLDINSYPQAGHVAIGNTGIILGFESDFENNHTTNPRTVMLVNDESDVINIYGIANNQGAYIRCMDSDGDEMGYMGSPNNDDMHFKGNATGSYIYFGAGSVYKFYSTNNVGGGFHPYDDNVFDLGWGSKRWDDLYATNGTIQTSDVNLKKDITNTTLGLNFINALRPVEYKWKEGSRKHQGFIAQEVKTVLDAQDVAAEQAMWGLNTIKDGTKVIVPVEDENGIPQKTEVDNEERQSLRYTELIAPLVKAVQELTTRVAALEG